LILALLCLRLQGSVWDIYLATNKRNPIPQSRIFSALGNYQPASLPLKASDDFSLELEAGTSSDSEPLYEVERLLDRRSEKKGFSYLVKWDNFSESQATWEPEDNLDSVKWMIEEFNEKYGKKQGVRRKLEKEKLAKLSERRRRKEKSKRSGDSLEFKTQLEGDEEEITEKLTKSAKLSPETQSSANPIEEGKSVPSPASLEKAKLALQRAALEEASTTGQVAMASVKMVTGNLALDVAVKILGCRKQGKTVFYAVLFKKRSDEGVVVVPQVCTHEELKVQAPWLLSQYLLDYARTDQVE